MSIKQNPLPLWERMVPNTMGLHDALTSLREAEQALDDENPQLVRSRIEDAYNRVVTVVLTLDILAKDNEAVVLYDGVAAMSQENSRRVIAENEAAERKVQHRHNVYARARETLDREALDQDRAGS